MGVIDVHDEAFVKRSVGTRGVDRAISCRKLGHLSDHGSERLPTRMAGIETRTNSRDKRSASDHQCP